jgi:hypothetical protein
MKSHTRTVIPIAGRKPAFAVMRGIPSIPAPIVVPAIKSVPLKVLLNISYPVFEVFKKKIINVSMRILFAPGEAMMMVRMDR